MPLRRRLKGTMLRNTATRSTSTRWCAKDLSAITTWISTARYSCFESVLKAHPQDPMAYGYVLMATVFRELYHQDLLDTTYYAHDNFLTSKRNVPVSAATRQRIEYLTDTGIRLADARIRANPNDKNAYFARGYLRGMHAVFITLVDHSFVSAARQGYASRNDSEQVLKLDPQYADAKMAIGIQ